MTGARILAIDDEPQIRRALRRTLESQDYDVRAVATGEDGIAGLAWHPDVVLLDLMLPDVDGIEVARRIRAQSSVPIIVLSARGEDEQKVRALDAGCDDYVTKPFSTDEMLARIRVALRHAAGHGTAPVMESDDLRIDLDRRLVTQAGREVHLTPTEYDVLKFLVQHAGKLVTHRMLLHEVWGADHVEETQYLHVFMSQLRRKIEPQGARPRYIMTEPGVGYRFRAPH